MFHAPSDSFFQGRGSIKGGSEFWLDLRVVWYCVESVPAWDSAPGNRVFERCHVWSAEPYRFYQKRVPEWRSPLLFAFIDGFFRWCERRKSTFLFDSAFTVSPLYSVLRQTVIENCERRVMNGGDASARFSESAPRPPVFPGNISELRLSHWA